MTSVFSGLSFLQSYIYSHGYPGAAYTSPTFPFRSTRELAWITQSSHLANWFASHCGILMKGDQGRVTLLQSGFIIWGWEQLTFLTLHVGVYLYSEYSRMWLPLSTATLAMGSSGWPSRTSESPRKGRPWSLLLEITLPLNFIILWLGDMCLEKPFQYSFCWLLTNMYKAALVC